MYFEFIALDVLIFFKRRGSEQNFFDKLSITLFIFQKRLIVIIKCVQVNIEYWYYYLI